MTSLTVQVEAVAEMAPVPEPPTARLTLTSAAASCLHCSSERSGALTISLKEADVGQ